VGGKCVCMPTFTGPKCAALNLLPASSEALFTDDGDHDATWGGNIVQDPSDGEWAHHTRTYPHLCSALPHFVFVFQALLESCVGWLAIREVLLPCTVAFVCRSPRMSKPSVATSSPCSHAAMLSRISHHTALASRVHHCHGQTQPTHAHVPSLTWRDVVATALMQCLVGRPLLTLIELNTFCFGLHPIDRPAMDGNAISAYTRHTPKLVYSCCSILIAVRAGRWHLFFAEFLNNCDLNSWGTNSVVAHGVSDTPSGPYRRVGVVQPAFHHNPTVA